MALIKDNEEELRRYAGEFGLFEYFPSEAEPIIDEKKALAYDAESGFTKELWDYNPDDTLKAAHRNPTEYDFLVRGWDFKAGMIPEGYHNPWNTKTDIDIDETIMDF